MQEQVSWALRRRMRRTYQELDLVARYPRGNVLEAIGYTNLQLGPRSDLKIKVSESLLHAWSMHEAFRAIILDAQRK